MNNRQNPPLRGFPWLARCYEIHLWYPPCSFTAPKMNGWKINHGGGWKIIFLFEWVICRWTMLIFQGVTIIAPWKWLEDDRLLLRWPIFRGRLLVSGSVTIDTRFLSLLWDFGFMKLQRPRETFGFTFQWQQVYDFAFFCQYKKMTNINQTEETLFDTGDFFKKHPVVTRRLQLFLLEKNPWIKKIPHLNGVHLRKLTWQWNIHQWRCISYWT